MNRPQIQSAAIYLIDGMAYIAPYNVSVEGLNVMQNHAVSVRLDDPARLGSALLDCFERCEAGVPHDMKDASRGKALLTLTRTRSWKRLQQRSVSVSAERRLGTDEIRLTPMRKEGRHSTELNDKEITSFNSPVQLGLAIKAALGEAK
jgi:hypothetical protein